MADLTTIDGLHVYFDPAAVMAVADRDATTGQAVTTVYGLSTGTGLYRIGEAVDAFLTRIGSMPHFARFTNLDGTFVWINCKAVKVVRAALAIEHGPQAKSVLMVGALTPPVTETPDQVQQIVHAHGGSL
jgi:hypothetical protein